MPQFLNVCSVFGRYPLLFNYAFGFWCQMFCLLSKTLSDKNVWTYMTLTPLILTLSCSVSFNENTLFNFVSIAFCSNYYIVIQIFSMIGKIRKNTLLRLEITSFSASDYSFCIKKGKFWSVYVAHSNHLVKFCN